MIDEQKEKDDEQNRFQNRWSKSSRKRSSIMSLERNNYDYYRDHSLTHKHSLVNVMSLEGSQKNEELFDMMLLQEKRRSLMRNSNNVKNEMEEQPIEQYRKSSANKFLRHECKCMGYCLQWFCPCFNQNKEMCTMESCCQNCVKTKTLRLQKQSKGNGCFCQNSKCENSYCKCFKGGKKCDPTLCSCQQCRNRMEIYDMKQHEHIQKFIKFSDRAKRLIEQKGYSAIQSLKCSCKKSNCLKNYCECFYYGVGCGPRCKCKSCRNVFEEEDDVEQVMIERERFGRIDSESEQEKESEDINIDSYFNEETYEENELPKSMEFEHPNFRNIFKQQ